MNQFVFLEPNSTYPRYQKIELHTRRESYEFCPRHTARVRAVVR